MLSNNKFKDNSRNFLPVLSFLVFSLGGKWKAGFLFYYILWAFFVEHKLVIKEFLFGKVCSQKLIITRVISHISKIEKN